MTILKDLLSATVLGMGYDFVDLEQSPRGRLIRVYIDAPQKAGGVDVEDCSLVSEQITRVLTVENIDYDRLEVSSPGMDRVLNKESDYIRFAGAKVSAKLRVPLQGRRNFQGILVGMKDDCLLIDCRDTMTAATTAPATAVTDAKHDAASSQTDIYELPLAQLDKVRLVPTFDEIGGHKK